MVRPISDRSTFAAWRVAPAGRCGAVRVRVLEPGPVGPGEVGVAYAVGRRAGGAVVRNRIRRRLRAAVRDLVRAGDQAGSGGLRPGAAYLWSAGVEAASCPFPVLRSWMVGAVGRARAAGARS